MTKLETINAEDLQNRTYEPTYFLVEELIPEGLHILAGAPKIGKSWLALWLCLCVAQGQALWNFATSHGEVLYLSLEDSFQRIQTRLFDLTEDAPSTLHFAIMADALKHGLEQQIEQFLTEHSDTKLVVIDTLQRVRSAGGDGNLYANDYQDIGLLKKLADKRHLAILLIHHLRKLHDDDPMNMISGSTGLSGAADSTFVLQKNSRLANIASLHCTGRDIPDRTLKLEFGEEDHVWKLLADSKTCSGASKISTLQLTKLLSELLRADSAYLGSPSALSAKIDPDGTLGITPKKITRLVRESVAALRENGILADTYRSNGKRWISLRRADSADFPSVKIIGTTGVLVNHRREYLGGKARVVCEADWLRHENFYPVIIEKAIWQKVQTRLKQQARPAVNNRIKHRYAGLLTCQECGNVFSPVIRYWNGNRRVEYVCRGYQRNGKDYCNSHRIHEAVLDKAIWDYTKKLREQYAAELKKVAQLQKQWALRKPVLDAHCLTLQKEILRLEQEVDELVMEKLMSNGCTSAHEIGT